MVKHPYLAGAVGGAAAGAVGGVVARAKDVTAMDQAVGLDLNALQSTGRLPEGVQPAFALEPRRDKSIVSRYLIGIAIGGFCAWLVTLLILLLLIEGSGEQASVAERVFSSQMFAALFGLCGFVVPGIPLGALLWLKESRARVREATAAVYRVYWSERERGAAALAQGQAQPEQVAQVLSRFHTGSGPDAR